MLLSFNKIMMRNALNLVNKIELKKLKCSHKAVIHSEKKVTMQLRFPSPNRE